MPIPEAADTSHRALARSLARGGVQYVLGSWVDLRGQARARATRVEDLPSLLAGAERYAAGELCGQSGASGEFWRCQPDLDTLTVLPWDGRFAWMASDLRADAGSPAATCPRAILRAQLGRSREQGYEPTLGLEVGLQPDARPAEEGSGPAAHQMDALLEAADALEHLSAQLSKIGLRTGAVDLEAGSGRCLVEIHAGSLLEMADRMVLLRLLLRRLGQHAGGRRGRGECLRLGLRHAIGPARSALRDGERVTEECRAFSAGIAAHAVALGALCASPAGAGRESGTVPRLLWPAHRPSIDLAGIAAELNPYLLTAFVLAAGLEGLGEGRALHAGDADPPWWQLAGAPADALQVFEQDPLARELFAGFFARARAGSGPVAGSGGWAPSRDGAPGLTSEA